MILLLHWLSIVNMYKSCNWTCFTLHTLIFQEQKKKQKKPVVGVLFFFFNRPVQPPKKEKSNRISRNYFAWVLGSRWTPCSIYISITISYYFFFIYIKGTFHNADGIPSACMNFVPASHILIFRPHKGGGCLKQKNQRCHCTTSLMVNKFRTCTRWNNYQ